MIRLRQRASIVLVLAAAAASCSSGGGEATDEQVEQHRAQVRSQISSATELQQEVLEDEFVTPGEADRAAAEVVQCAQDAGVTVRQVWNDDAETMGFDVSGGATEDEAELSLAAFDECYGEHFRIVDSMIAMQNALSTADRERRDGIVRDCLEAEGFEVGSWPDVSVDPDPVVEADCVDQANQEIGA